MRGILLSGLACLLVLIGFAPAQAQTGMPEHRYLYANDTDFFGADLTNLFDTSQAACARACSAQKACVAFTFNLRNNACFPKSAITERQTYEGARSAQKVATAPDVLAAQGTLRAELEFLQPADFDAANDFITENAQRFSFNGETLASLLAASSGAVQSGDMDAALRWAGKAAALSDSSEVWAEMARLALQRAQSGSSKERRQFRREALLAGVNSTLRGGGNALRAENLSILARALEANGRGRDMIPALRHALSLTTRDDITDALDEAIGKYGFRVTDHRVENDAAAPRICAEFSENLALAGVDYEPFVRVEGRGLVVQAQERQLCLDGVEHGQRYTLTLRAGLPAASGEVLHKDVALNLYVRDRSPSVRFPGRAYVLPRSAQAALPVETVNATTLDLTLRRVSDRNLVRAIRESYFGRPLSAYEDDAFASDIAQEIWRGTATVQNELNTDMVTRLPMGEALEGQAPGVYALSAMLPGQDRFETPAAMQWFVLSDLGLSTWAGVDGLQVAVRRLGDTSAQQGMTVSLISRANAVLGTAVTDADGVAQFAAGLSRGTGAARPALVMVEDGTNDIAFLPLTDPAFDLSDRGVSGHPPAPPIDTFLTTDRGAYRVGEVVYATVLTRDARGTALEGLPLTAIFKRPDGVEYSRHQSAASSAGGHMFDLPLGTEVPRGAWRLDIHSDLSAPPLASDVVLVEDFLPERIDFDLALPDGPLRIDQSPPLDVDVRYLFGAPGADLPVSGDVRLRAVRSLEGWDGYQFGRHDSAFRTRTRAIERTMTDAQGRARFALALPVLEEPVGLPLEAQVTLRVSEGSGRPVERRLTKALLPETAMIGVKPLFEDVLPEGAEAGFDLVAVAADGSATQMPVTWTVNRVETRYQWYQLYGNWAWEPTTRRIRIATGEVMLGTEPVSISAPTEWGTYEVIVERRGAPYTVSSVAFSSGWYGGDGADDSPDRLEMSLDAEGYTLGDTARLRLVSEAEGLAMVTVLSNRVVDRKMVAVTAGENTIDLPVTDDWGTGAYVTASVLRGMDVAAGMNPARQLGLAHAAVAPGDKALSVRIDAPAEVDGQAGTLRAAVVVEGVAEGETAYVTLAAVDQGILNLTGFEAPDVTDHYFGQRRLGVEMRDIYGRLIDGMAGALGTVRSGGDASPSVSVQSPPPTEKLMAHFSGPVTVGPDGRAEIEIIKPAFNGTIRLMAVAWSRGGVGDASTEVIAKDPVVVNASLSRFLSPGDQSRLLLEMVNTTDEAGNAQLQIYADAGIALGDVPGSVPFKAKGSAQLVIPVTAREIGDHLITVVLSTPEGTALRKVLTLPVRDNDPEVAVTRQFTLGAGEVFTFDNNVFAGLRPGTATATLTAGPLARFDVPGLLQQLDRYPYGCTEQVTSGALPLLYLSNVAQDAGLGAPAQINNKITAAIERILSRQTSNGAFGLWNANAGAFWLDAYVTDFLSRARAKGHVIPQLAFTLAMDNLRNRIAYAPDFDKGGEDIAYALLVLAREGAARMGDLRYYADTKAQDFATPLSVAQLGAALASYGDPVRADAMFRRAGAMLARARETGWRDDFGTARRDAAAVLKLSAEAGSNALKRTDLLTLMRSNTSRMSTQEAAQVVLAAHALGTTNAFAGLIVDGAPSAGPVVKRLSDRVGGASVIENTGADATDVTLTTFGVPEITPEAGGYGYKITRRLFDTEGLPVAGPVASGTRMVAVIEVTPFEETGARLIIDDPLPAGFEIDNPNLIRSGDISALDWLTTSAVETVEFRSDRFVAAVDHRGADPFRLAYVVRAVTPGRYHHPAATVADMYRTEYRANTTTQEVVVTP